MSASVLHLICVLLLSVVLTDHLGTAAKRSKPARLVRGQEEWPASVGCPTGFVEDLRPKAKKQWRPGYVVCAKGNTLDCVHGTSWYLLNPRFCFKCVCKDGLADCLNHDCPPPKPVWRTKLRYNCGRRDEKVCPKSSCKFLSRDHRCVFCDCPGGRA